MKKLIIPIFTLLVIFAVAPALAQEGQKTVTLVHFSDYHSYAVPFYGEGQANQAGIARLIAYIKPITEDPNALVFSGGDTLNVGALGWSDKYQCTEWSWFNGLLDTMAFGNHDADYGPDTFAQCQAEIDYPILSSNTLDAGGQPFFQFDGKTYQVFEVNGLKIGVFAVAGTDYERLVKPEVRPVAGATFGDPVQAAREAVTALREDEQVDAVVMIGHGLYEEQVELAQTVPGIDLIFGTHSHRKEELTKIPNSDTYIISPFQYLTYVSNVQLTFDDGILAGVNGSLVQMSNDLPEDPDIAQQVNQMQADLEADPQYADLYETVGEAAVELSTAGQFVGEGLLGNFVMDIFRDQAQANMALSTSSSFRQPLPPGPITEEALRSAMPYTNKVVVFEMTGDQVQELLNYSVSRAESDFFSQVSGVRFNIDNGQATNIQLLTDPAKPASGYVALDPAATYKVATTDFQGLIAGGYKEIFEPAPFTKTDIDVRDEVRKVLQSGSPVSAQLDGRISVGAAPAQLPVSGGQPITAWAVVIAGLCLISLGLLVKRQALAP